VRRPRLAGALAVSGAAAVAAARRRRARPRERVDVFFADGATVSLAAGSPEGDRLLAIARDALGPRP
jgi:hypothetical protein